MHFIVSTNNLRTRGKRRTFFLTFVFGLNPNEPNQKKQNKIFPFSRRVEDGFLNKNKLYKKEGNRNKGRRRKNREERREVK